jgi:WD40 repeat protein
VVGLNHEGSSLLVLSGPRSELIFPHPFPIWTIPLPAGEPRRLGDIEAQDASFSLEGHILFSQGRDLYLAEKDGSNPHKLLSADGLIGEPSMSPDGTQIVFTQYATSFLLTIFEANADGSGLRPIATANEAPGFCCARWMPDGRYIVFQNRGSSRGDLWMLPMKPRFLQRSRQLIQLTAGPLSYAGPVPSRDGKQILAVGTKQRGELVRYDMNSKQFVPILSGVSAFNPSFSRDGKWVAYASYPDHTLWRSRSDGTDRLQLTYPPVQVEYPHISPDGKRVAYGTSEAEIYVIGMEGGLPQKVVEKRTWVPSWSPDGNRLVYADYSEEHIKFRFLDLRTGNRSMVTGSQDLLGVQWVAEDILVAATRDHKRLVVFDVKTQKWSDLVSFTPPGTVVNWFHSPDYKYVYYTTGGSEPQALRVRLADHKVETITSLKDLPRATGPDGNTQIGVAPDGSAVFTRDIGTQEIYALTVKWP